MRFAIENAVKGTVVAQLHDQASASALDNDIMEVRIKKLCELKLKEIDQKTKALLVVSVNPAS